MKSDTCSIDISFRFLHLNKLQAYTLVRDIPESTHKLPKDKDSYVGCVPLTAMNIDDINDFYVRQRIDVSDCDIFVAVVSESDTNIIDVSPVVNRMLKYIDCQLTYSFTVI